MSNVNSTNSENLTLKNLRENANKTQIDVAEELGTDRTTVSKWESGEIVPSIRRVFQYAAAIGCSVDSIIYSIGYGLGEINDNN